MLNSAILSKTLFIIYITLRPLRTLRTSNGGPERDQTADLLVANEALYQLSYRPERNGRYWEIGARK